MFNQITPVVKNIIIICTLFFLASFVLPTEWNFLLAGHYPGSITFRPWQIVTHMFMHGDLMHIFFNMYGLFLFGSALERVWGPKKFLTYYFVCGIGAFALYNIINYIEIMPLLERATDQDILDVNTQGIQLLIKNFNFSDNFLGNLNASLNGGMVGASGAIFGILLGFGMLYPNTELMLLFPPIPIKAKWFVMIYGALELYLAAQNRPGDNVAHYAHIGGMLFGYILLKIWQRKRNSFY